FPPPQVMDSPYANGAYTPPYHPAAPSAAPHYASLPQTRGYYCSGPPQPPYPTESTGIYRPPSPAPSWSYAPQDCPTEGSSLRRQQVPGYSPPQTPGMPVPQYPYGEGNPGITAQGPPPQPRPPEDTWSPSTAYGVQSRYGWHSALVPGNNFASEPHPPWAASGAPAHPPAWDPKDYDKPSQGTNQHSYYPEVHQQPSGTLSEQRAGSSKPLAPQAKVQYSAQPHMYDAASRKHSAGAREVGFRAAEHPLPGSAAIQPEIQRILQVMGEAEQLEQEVDEFVGKKTEKSYRLLEEMLTKLLLELDSVETGGQDSVRQARKESVHRIQAILEKLERKGL
ncbi:BAG4 regulator, partial [Psilopogon haemacephalus]|nr:BAG4 regulator [Psilopogon haemacephalus]